MEENKFYVYVYLDPRKPGKFIYGEYSFDFEPFYVGKGNRTRMYKHLWESEENTTNIYKHRIIRKIIEEYSLKPIIIKYKSGLNNEESYLLEIDMIKNIGRKKDGGPLANFLDGGFVKNIDIERQKTKSITRLQYDLFGNFIKEWKSAKEVERELGINNSLISSACLGKIHTAGGFVWKNKFENQKFVKNIREECKRDFSMKFSKPISQFSIDGVLIKEWESINKAQNVTGIKNISYCVNGKRNKAGGFIWKYTNC